MQKLDADRLLAKLKKEQLLEVADYNSILNALGVLDQDMISFDVLDPLTGPRRNDTAHMVVLVALIVERMKALESRMRELERLHASI